MSNESIPHIESQWDSEPDPLRKIRILRGQPIEYAEEKVKHFTHMKEMYVQMQEFHAAAVAREAAEAFRKLL